MKVRNPLFFVLGLLLTVPVGYFVMDRIEFLSSSQKTMSTVEDVWAENSRCGSRKRRRSCTKYHARLLYQVGSMSYRLNVTAGSETGHNQPLSMADHRVKERVRVAYDPSQPRRAYRDTFWDIWGTPLVTFFVQICVFFGGFTEKRRKT